MLGVLGAGLLLVPARRLRPDVLLCADWPPLAVGAVYGVIYLGGVGLLCASWLSARRVLGEGDVSLRRVLLLGLPVHLVALCGPPFLSPDTLFYAALGRSLAAGGRPDTPVSEVLGALPAAEAFLRVLPPHWRGGTSSYGPAFELLAGAVGRVAGDRLWLHLRLYQATGLAASLGAAALTGLAAGPGAAALVLFCPLLVIEGTGGAHNDVLLALCCAAFALLVLRRRPAWAALALAAGLLVKASALLLLSLQGCVLGLRRLAGRRGVALAAVVAVTVSAAALPWLLRSHAVVAAVGGPAGAFEYCTRSLECLPRVLLRYVLHAPGAARGVALAFRGLGVLWLLLCAAGAIRDERAARASGDAAAGRALLRWSGTFLFGYYLYLHGWSQSWYLLPLLPLLPYADPRLRPAMMTLCVTAVAYYALALPLNCVTSDLAIALSDLAEAVVVIVPPSLVLLRMLRHGNTAPC